jgi:hypothetical protein
VPSQMTGSLCCSLLYWPCEGTCGRKPCFVRALSTPRLYPIVYI